MGADAARGEVPSGLGNRRLNAACVSNKILPKRTSRTRSSARITCATTAIAPCNLEETSGVLNAAPSAAAIARRTCKGTTLEGLRRPRRLRDLSYWQTYFSGARYPGGSLTRFRRSSF